MNVPNPPDVRDDVDQTLRHISRQFPEDFARAVLPPGTAIRDLRCRLAMQLHAADWDVAQAECAPFMSLQSGAKKP